MKRLIILLSAVMLSAGLFGQARSLSGTVTDNTGEALIGATVVLVSESGATSGGTTTDLDGNFSIRIPQGINRILVSYIGYTDQEVDISGRNSVDVILAESTEQLEEVVVTALGLKKDKKALGYAFSDVDGEELTTNRDVNFINVISNKVAGVNISQTAGGAGTSSRIIIRGIKSVTSSSQPLIVIDGVPMDNASDGASWLGGIDYGNSLMGISPDDIETMSVLKGPSAAALYGSRGGNGVILITTKQGGKRDRMKVTINSNFMFDRAYVVANYQNDYGAGFGGGIQWQGLSEDLQEELGIDSAYFYHSYGSWGPKMDTGYQVLNWNYKMYDVTPQPDNVKDYFEKGYTFTNSVAIENGNEAYNWRLSASSLNNKGLKPNSRYDRKTVNYNMNASLTDRISASFKANYIREDAFNRVGQGDSRTGARTFIWMPRSINMENLRNDYMDENGYEMNWYNSDSWHTNPYWEAYKNYNNDNKDHFNGFAKIDIRITDWLSAYVRSSMDTYTTKRYTRVANKAFRANGEGSFNEMWVKLRSLNHELLLSANYDLGEKLKLNANLGGNLYQYHSNRQSSTIYGLATPDFFSLNNAKYPAETTVGTSLANKEIQSVYGTLALSYKSWLYTELTARQDWSSAIPVGYFYPSFNTSLVFSELFRMDKSILSFGKIRGSVALAGNDTSPYRTSTPYISGQYGDFATVGISNTAGNPNLKNEDTFSWELGTDMRFFMNRINLEVTYYDESTYDQIMTAEMSKASGFSHAIVNGGVINNRGIELQLDVSPVKRGQFSWDIAMNFAKNKNTVVSLYEGLNQYTITGESQIDIIAVPGRPYGEIIGTRLARFQATNEAGDPIDHPGNGRPLIGDDGMYIMEERGVIGNVTPDFAGGISNMLSYGNLSMNFSIGFSVGGDIFSKTNKYGKDNGQFAETTEGRDSWYAATTDERLRGRKGLYNADGSPLLDEEEDQLFAETSDPVGYVADGVLADGSENIKGIDPQVYYHQRKWGGIAELDVYDASYVKLRDVTLNYNMPKKWFNEDSSIKSMSVSLIGRNLWLIYSGVPNIDPESSFTSNNNGIGQEYAAMPTTRSFGVNLRVVF